MRKVQRQAPTGRRLGRVYHLRTVPRPPAPLGRGVRLPLSRGVRVGHGLSCHTIRVTPGTQERARTTLALARTAPDGAKHLANVVYIHRTVGPITRRQPRAGEVKSV